MKNVKKIFHLFFAVVLALFAVCVSACKDKNGNKPEPKAYEITLNYKELVLDERSADTQLTATVLLDGKRVENPALVWKSNDESVVTVVGGLVKVVGVGETSLLCALEESSAMCTVTVHKYYEAEFKILLERNRYTLPMYEANHSFPVAASVIQGETSLSLPLVWESLTPSVATVDAEGRVTIVGGGKGYIKVSATDGKNTATAVITILVGEIEADEDSSDVTVDDKDWQPTHVAVDNDALVDDKGW